MKEKIEQFAKGSFLYELPEICLSEECILITVEAGDVYHGSFQIANSKASRMKGILYSSCRSMVLEQEQFVGEQNEISYHFSAAYDEAGTLVSGEIHIISDCGELEVPFRAAVEYPACNSTIGKIKDLFQLANLAKTDWLEAKQLFQSEQFKRVLHYYDKKYDTLYHYLLAGGSASRALEEFLVGVHKKSRINYKVIQTNFEFDNCSSDFSEKINITKDTWGFGELHVSTDASFIELERKNIWTGEFVGSTFELGFLIRPGKMRKGFNYANITLSSPHQEFKIPVSCHVVQDNKLEMLRKRKIRQSQLKLLENYLDFRFNIISAGQYVSLAGDLLSVLQADVIDSTACALYRIHLQMVSGKEAMAKTSLSVYMEELEEWESKSALHYSAMLYLEALIRKDPAVAANASKKIYSLYQSHLEEWMLLWFLLYLDKRYETQKQLRFDAVKKQFLQGCHSPVLYYEAVMALNEDPSILKEIGAFEIQILHFGVKRKAFTKEVVLQAAYLACRVKYFLLPLYRVLTGMFKKNKQKELLFAICSLLIKGRRREESYFRWYQAGVGEQLRVTELHEYYMYTLKESLDVPLPQPVLTYFSFHSSLTEKKKSFLYANLIRHKEQYPAIYAEYEKTMSLFAFHQLMAGNMNRYLAVLYAHFITKDVLTEGVAKQLPKVAFCHELECSNPNIKAVCVVHKELGEEVLVPLSEGRAYINIFTENAEILLMDEKNNRYTATIPYTIHRFPFAEEVLMECLSLGSDNQGLLLHLAAETQYRHFDLESVEILQRTLQIPGLDQDYLRECERKLIYFYYDNFEADLLAVHLAQLNLNCMTKKDRIKMIEFMIIQELYDQALKALLEFGFEGVAVKRLLKLCTRLLQMAAEKKLPKLLLELSYYVFSHGKYDEGLLKYLVDNYFGATAQMLDIWKAARNFDLETTSLEERLLVQMLFSENGMQEARALFKIYYHKGCNHKLIRAFLDYYSYKFLVRDWEIEAEVFDIIKREANYEENDICILALLKYYSGKEYLTDAECNFSDIKLHQMIQKGLVLPFFTKFKGKVRIPGTLFDKYYIEYHANAGSLVRIHYNIDGNREKEQYDIEDMKNVCNGIFVKEFVLFFNERLQYYISEEDNGERRITESAVVTLEPEACIGEDTRYQQINLIITAMEMQDDDTVIQLLSNYVKASYQMKKLFYPI